jgi:hypothetical protein
MSIISNLKAYLGAFFLLLNPGHDELAEEIKRNCSITENIKVGQSVTGTGSKIPGYRESLLLECELCGSLVKYLWPHIETKGTHLINDGSWEYKFGELFRVAALYHEMGHIAHKDEESDTILRSKTYHTKWRRTLRAEYHDADELLDYLALLNGSDFAADLKRIQQYVDQAKRFFESTGNPTILGTYISKILREEKSLWHAPKCNVCFHEKKYKIGQEARADLFSADKLWLNGRIDVLIAIAYLFASSEHIIADEHDVHPSGLERALMFIGFLMDKGMDFNVLIEDFEKNPLEEIHSHRTDFLLTQVKDELIAEHWAHSNRSCTKCKH